MEPLSDRQRVPNLFIVGAPRAGTRAMYTYLGEHPDVFMCPVKEPAWFGSDLPGERYCDDVAEYLELFADAGRERWLGEASPWYLLSRNAATEIRELSPDARIIVMLRDPVALIESLHANALFEGDEDQADVAAALELEPERRAGRAVPPAAQQPHSLLYRAATDYAPQVERYLKVFGRERVHVVIFEEFVADTAAHYSATLRFLGADPAFAPEFRPLNSNRRARSGALRRLYMQPPEPLRAAVRRMVPRSVVKRVWTRGLWPQLHRLNTAHAPRQPMPAEVRHRLRAELRPSIRRLEAVLGRELLPLWGG